MDFLCLLKLSCLSFHDGMRINLCGFTVPQRLELCPNSVWIQRKSVPFSSRCVAKECLKVCSVTFFRMPALLTACLSTLCALLEEYWPPLVPSKRYSLGVYNWKQSLSRGKILAESSPNRSLLPLAFLMIICIR